MQEGLSRNKQDTHSAWSCSTHPHKLSWASSRLHTPKPSSLRIPTLQSISLNPRTLPPAQPLCLQRKPRHCHPPQPSSRDSKAPHQDLQWFQGVPALPAAAPAPLESKRLRVWLCNPRLRAGRQDTGVNINLALTHRQSLAVWHRARSPPHRGLRKTTAGPRARVLLFPKARGKKYLTVYRHPSLALHIYPPRELQQQSRPCLLIMGCKDKNVLLCQKSVLLVDKFVVIPPLRRVSSLMSQRHITLSERPSNIYETAFKSRAANPRGRAELIAVRWGWGAGAELMGWGTGSGIFLGTLSFCRVRVQTLLEKGAGARVYLFKDGGEKRSLFIL